MKKNLQMTLFVIGILAAVVVFGGLLLLFLSWLVGLIGSWFRSAAGHQWTSTERWFVIGFIIFIWVDRKVTKFMETRDRLVVQAEKIVEQLRNIRSEIESVALATIDPKDARNHNSKSY